MPSFHRPRRVNIGYIVIGYRDLEKYAATQANIGYIDSRSLETIIDPYRSLLRFLLIFLSINLFPTGVHPIDVLPIELLLSLIHI